MSSRLGMAEEGISELETISTETSRTEKRRLKKTEKNQNRIPKNHGTTTKGVTYTFENTRRRRERGTKKIFEDDLKFP